MGCEQSSTKDAKTFNQELTFRGKNLKNLQSGLEHLKKTVSEHMVGMMKLPNNLSGIGEGYTGVNACLRHGASSSSAGGAAGNYGDASVNNNNNNNNNSYSAVNNNNNNNGGGGNTRVNRGVAQAAGDSAEQLSETMRSVKDSAYAKFRQEVEKSITKPIDDRLAELKTVGEKAKKVNAACSKYVEARKKAERLEEKLTAAGKDASADQSYTKAVTERDAAEAKYTPLLKEFGADYEALMQRTQETVAVTMPQLLALSQAYQLEVVRGMESVTANSRYKFDSAAMEEASREASYSMPRNTDNNNNNSSSLPGGNNTNANNNDSNVQIVSPPAAKDQPSPIRDSRVNKNNNNNNKNNNNDHHNDDAPPSYMDAVAEEGISTRPHTPTQN